MRGTRTLSRADRLLRARKFSQVISLLESQVFLYRDNATFYRLLGTACLYVGDYGGAYSYLQRAEQIKGGDVRVELGLAAVHLRRREVRDALNLWLSILDRDPGNVRAKRGLSLVRRTEDPTEFVTMAESGRLTRFFPPLGLHIPGWIPVALGLAGIVVAAAFLVPPLVSDLVARMRDNRAGGEPITEEELPEDLTTVTGEFQYVFTDRQIESLVNRVGDLFNSFRDNLAQREANRILLSNAGPLIKERIRLVSSYFRTPSFVEPPRDNFTYDEVAAEPWIYDACHVRWRGQTSNIAVTEEAITFTLLVGYEDERVLEGTVPVRVPFTADVQPGPIELIGRVEYEGDSFSLVAASIRRIASGTDR
ncbi:MAG: tetratricopeptide repeat protein [Spirochaetota bacterium]